MMYKRNVLAVSYKARKIMINRGAMIRPQPYYIDIHSLDVAIIIKHNLVLLLKFLDGILKHLLGLPSVTIIDAQLIEYLVA